MKRFVLLLLAVVMLAVGVGCAALSQIVTPARVDDAAVQYAASAGVANVSDFDGFANLEKALRLELKVDDAYEVKSLAIKQMTEKNELDYRQLKGVTAANTKEAMAREEQLFGEKGLLSMGLSLMGFGTFTGVLGLMRKRPGDITQQEMEQAVTSIKGEVTTKDRQIIELVRGVQIFLDTHPKGDVVGDELRTALRGEQSADTKKAVAIAKTA